MILKKHMFKSFIISFFLINTTVSQGCVICVSAPCNSVLTCAMTKQRKSLKARLEDLINTIKENTKQTENQTKIIEQEVLAYRRLLERVKKESLSLKEASYLVKKIKNSEALGTSIDIIGKGK